MRVVIYVRESTNFQNPEAQLAECLEYCKQNNMEVVKTYKDIASGAKSNRKQFLKMQEDMEDDLFDGIVLWELSRSTRDFITYKMMINRMFELGKELYSLQEGRLTEDNIDMEFSTDMRAMLNSYERKRVGRRIKFRKSYSRKQGLWTGGQAPLGYKIVNTQLQIDENTVNITKNIFSRFCNGEGVTQIANSYGFDYKKVRRMLQNPIYIGYIKDNQTEMIRDKRVVHKDYKIIKGIHQSIISDEVFQKAAILLKIRIRKQYNKGSYLLSSIFDYHGNRLYPCLNGKQPYYQNSKKNTKAYNLHKLENEVINELIANIEKMCLLNSVEQSEEAEIKVSKEVYLKKELEKLKDQFNKLLKQYLNGIVSEEIFETISKEIKEQEKSLEQEIQTIQIQHEQRKKRKLKEENVESLKKYLEKLQNTKDRIKLKEILDLIIYEVRMINDFRFYIVTNLY